MTPVGSELDAAVLRAIGWRHQPGYENEMVTVSDMFIRPDECDIFVVGKHRLSTDPNGHEALRLCGPWLDAHTWRWSMETDPSGTSIMFWERIGAFPTTLQRVATRAEAICRLVLAIAEREVTNTKGTTNGSQS